MTVYTLEEAEDKLTTVLEKATVEGEVCIKGEKGRLFTLRPDVRRSPLDVEGVDLDLSREEIVSIVRESRER
jgi:hypothetical protein